MHQTTPIDRRVESQINLCLAELRDGRGGTLIVEGDVGIGKSTVLELIRTQAQGQRVRVLATRATQLDRHDPFGVARDLLNPGSLIDDHDDAGLLAGAGRLAAALSEDRLGPPTAAPSSISHQAWLRGLTGLVRHLVAFSPLVLMVDDAHDADPQSLGWLHYLQGRTSQHGVLIVLAVEASDPLAESEPMFQLCVDPAAVVLQLQALAPAAVADVIQRHLAGGAVPEFVNACQHMTQGNPFLLTEVLRECLAGSAEEASLVRRCVPASVARSVLLRLNRAGPDAIALARGVAILGDGVDLRQAARLAGLDPSASLAAADTLSARRILCDGRPLAFSYPLVRNAVYQRMSAGERALGHARAACVLVAADEPVEGVAEHLLHCEPGNDEWVAETLQFAARQAMRDWAWDAAIGYLERALREETSRSTRFSLLLDLGIVQSHIDGPAALEALDRAGRAAVDPDQIAAAAEELAGVLTLSGRPDEALVALRAAAADVETRAPELACRLQRRIPLAAQLVPGSRSTAVGGLHEPDADQDPLLLQYLAVDALLQGAPAQRAAELARRSLASASPGAEEPISLSSTAAIDVLCLSGHPHDAQREIDRTCRLALQRHSSTAIVTSAAFAARVALARGRLYEAERQARLGLGHARAGSWDLMLPLLTASLLDVLVERGEIVDALAIAEYANERAIRAADAPLYSNVLLVSLGRLGVTCGHPRAGLADLLLAGERATASAVTNPAVLPWRSEAALAHVALGEHEAGRELAAEELAHAQTFGAPRALGIALRTVALVAFAEDDHDGAISRLREATAMLEAAGAAVELARASVELGVVLRRCRPRDEAREPLRRGLDLAHRCGALAIESRARTELLATGSRPRRASLEGRDALTPRERLVAQLAAQGQSNRDIAGRLFLSPKTVESHLSRVFRKLQVKSRDELPAALDAGPPAVEQAL